MSSPRHPLDPQLARWREDTPGCSHRNHLNNAGAALMPRPVVAAMTDHLQLEAEIGGYEAADARREAIEQTSGAVASLIGAESRNVAITGSATAAFVQAITSFDFRPGDAIVTTLCDYTSYQIQFLALAQRLGVRILHADDLPEGGVDPDSVARLARTPGVRLVHVSWVPTNSGLVQDVESVGAICEQLGVPYLVDACQAVGQMPVDVARLRCDYLSATARKFLRGPRGIGFLYASDRALARGDHPLMVDMRGAEWIAPDQYRIADSARRYEDWEFAYALVLGLGSAARYALEVGIPRAQDGAMALARRLRERLATLPAVRLLDGGTDPCAIVTAAVSGWSGPDLVAELARHGINGSASLRWYGQFDFARKGVESALRLSPHYYNTADEVDAAADVLAGLPRERCPC